MAGPFMLGMVARYAGYAAIFVVAGAVANGAAVYVEAVRRNGSWSTRRELNQDIQCARRGFASRTKIFHEGTCAHRELRADCCFTVESARTVGSSENTRPKIRKTLRWRQSLWTKIHGNE